MLKMRLTLVCAFSSICSKVYESPDERLEDKNFKVHILHILHFDRPAFDGAERNPYRISRQTDSSHRPFANSFDVKSHICLPLDILLTIYIGKLCDDAATLLLHDAFSLGCIASFERLELRL